jgi:pRiA4b ORF-3-like protein
MDAQEYVFDADLLDTSAGCQVALREDQTLVDLHQTLQRAFRWDDDHLFSFWLSGEFWARDGSERTAPFDLEPGQQGADVRLGSLGLTEGQRIAYLFDFGDEWRVLLTLAAIRPLVASEHPAILEHRGEAPPQYPGEDE